MSSIQQLPIVYGKAISRQQLPYYPNAGDSLSKVPYSPYLPRTNAFKVVPEKAEWNKHREEYQREGILLISDGYIHHPECPYRLNRKEREYRQQEKRVAIQSLSSRNQKHSEERRHDTSDSIKREFQKPPPCNQQALS
jgi:hypothetical protein